MSPDHQRAVALNRLSMAEWLIDERLLARWKGDYPTADGLRILLERWGWRIIDTGKTRCVAIPPYSKVNADYIRLPRCDDGDQPRWIKLP